MNHHLAGAIHDDAVTGHRDEGGRRGGETIHGHRDLAVVIREHVVDRDTVEYVAAGGVHPDVQVAPHVGEGIGDVLGADPEVADLVIDEQVGGATVGRDLELGSAFYLG